MPSEKRQRQDEGRLNRRLAEHTETKRQRRTRTARNVAIVAVAALAFFFLYSVVAGDDGDETVDTATSSTTTTVDPTASTTPEPITVAYPGPGEAITGETPCPKADGSSKRTTSFTQAPSTCITAGKTYVATVETTEGTMEFTLDAEQAPVTVNNFVVLARYHFYDGVPFHRIMPGFVDQAGTPVDQADSDLITKNPGYTIDEELPDSTDPAAVYPDGTLAMAKQAAPSTSSSQFFIVIDSGGSQLTVTYTPFGRVTKGLEVAKAINAFGDSASNGTPTKAITITKVTITES